MGGHCGGDAGHRGQAARPHQPRLQQAGGGEQLIQLALISSRILGVGCNQAGNMACAQHACLWQPLAQQAYCEQLPCTTILSHPGPLSRPETAPHAGPSLSGASCARRCGGRGATASTSHSASCWGPSVLSRVRLAWEQRIGSLPLSRNCVALMQCWHLPGVCSCWARQTASLAQPLLQPASAAAALPHCDRHGCPCPGSIATGNPLLLFYAPELFQTLGTSQNYSLLSALTQGCAKVIGAQSQPRQQPVTHGMHCCSLSEVAAVPSPTRTVPACCIPWAQFECVALAYSCSQATCWPFSSWTAWGAKSCRWVASMIADALQPCWSHLAPPWQPLALPASIPAPSFLTDSTPPLLCFTAITPGVWRCGPAAVPNRGVPDHWRPVQRHWH